MKVPPIALRGLRADEPDPRELEEPPLVPPPSTFTVTHDHKVVLFTADGQALVRRAGF
jgi:hypothetical protein